MFRKNWGVICCELPLLKIGYFFQFFIYLRFIILPEQLDLHGLQRFRSDTN